MYIIYNISESKFAPVVTERHDESRRVQSFSHLRLLFINMSRTTSRDCRV